MLAVVVSVVSLKLANAITSYDVGPSVPFGPVGPIEPVNPWIPCSPFSPLGPVGPIGPASPFSPFEPVGPTIFPEANHSLSSSFHIYKIPATI